MIVPPGTMVGMETITAGVPPMGAITRIIGTVTDGDSASDLVLGLTGIMAFRTDMVLGGALCTSTPTPTRTHLINASGGSQRKRVEPSRGNSLGSIPSE